MANVTVTITGDAASLRRSLGDAGSQLDAFQAKAKSVGDAATSIGRSMTIGLTLPIIAWGKSAFDAASDLNESMSKADTIFGRNKQVIRDWASTSAQAFGQSKQQALENAASFGNMFTQLGLGIEPATRMSQKMVELASDFASFHNADISDVLLAQQAAFRGEYDAVQRFVPTINAAAVQTRAMADSGKDNAAALTDQEKAVAAYELMVEGAGKATGDFQRTQDGAANSLRIANAEITNASAAIGSQLLPIVAGVAGVVADLVTSFSELPEGVQQIVLGGAAIVAAYGPAAYIFGAVSKGISGIIGIVQTASSWMQTLALKAMYAWDALKNMSKADILQYGAWAGFVAGAVAVGVAIDTYLGGSEGGLAKFAEGVKKAQDAGKNWGQTIVAGAKESAAPLDELRARLDTLRTSQEGVNKQYDAGKLSAAEAAAQHGKYAGAIAEVKGAIAGYKQAQDEAKAADAARKADLDAVNDGVMQLASSSQSAQQAVRDLASAQLAAAGGALGLEQANLNAEKAQDAFTEAVQRYGPFSREAREASLNLQQAHLAVQAAADKATDTQDDFTRAVQEGPSAIDALIGKIRGEIAANGDASGALSERIYKLLEAKLAIEGIPRSHATDIIINGLDSAKTGVWELRGALESIVNTDWAAYVRVDGADPIAGSIGLPPISSDRNIKKNIVAVSWAS